MNNPQISWAKIKIETIKKERLSGKNKTSGSKAKILDELNLLIKKAKTLTSPRTITLKLPVTSCDLNTVIINKDSKFHGRGLSMNIRGAEYVYLFLVTIGEQIEKEASRLMADDKTLEGYLLDRIGSVIVESLAENIESDIRKEYEEKHFSVSLRYSPGYCDWPIEEQVILEKLLNFSKIGVTLNENCMMIPKKSISGLIAIGPKNLFKKKQSQCVICSHRDCSYRRI